MTKDIGPILEGWPHEPGKISVRKIRGGDGRVKIQLRLDLGLLQMEAEGRPDGLRPYNCESMLGHFEKLLRRHRRSHETEKGFAIDEKHCDTRFGRFFQVAQYCFRIFIIEIADRLIGKY